MSDWYLGSSWANDQTRYGSRHRWQRKMALRNLRATQKCPRCGDQLIPESFKGEDGKYRVPRGWLAKNLHLDHRDGSDTSYLGLAHAACNVRATKRRKVR